MRAMASIKSELARRQKIFSSYDVNHINAYHKLFQNGEAKEPLPHLFIISDEFAELKKEQPDFMTELVSAANRTKPWCASDTGNTETNRSCR